MYDEDHTLGNTLRMMLNQNPKVALPGTHVRPRFLLAASPRACMLACPGAPSWRSAPVRAHTLMHTHSHTHTHTHTHIHTHATQVTFCGYSVPHPLVSTLESPSAV